MPKAPGVYRVLALGDPTTYGIFSDMTFRYVAEPCPERLEHLVDERVGPGKFEVLNAGVPDYNSFMAVTQLRGKLRDLRPDLVTVRYGWNDRHAGSHADGTRRFCPKGGLTSHSIGTSTTSAASWSSGMRRVPRSCCSPPRTRPHGRASGRCDEFPDTMTAKRLIIYSAIPTFERLIEIHDAYAGARRRVGRELGVPVVDMEEAHRQHAAEHLYNGMDVVPRTQEGHNLEAGVLYRRMVAGGMVIPARTFGPH